MLIIERCEFKTVVYQKLKQNYNGNAEMNSDVEEQMMRCHFLNIN